MSNQSALQPCLRCPGHLFFVPSPVTSSETSSGITSAAGRMHCSLSELSSPRRVRASHVQPSAGRRGRQSESLTPRTSLLAWHAMQSRPADWLGSRNKKPEWVSYQLLATARRTTHAHTLARRGLVVSTSRRGDTPDHKKKKKTEPSHSFSRRARETPSFPDEEERHHRRDPAKQSCGSGQGR